MRLLLTLCSILLAGCTAVESSRTLPTQQAPTRSVIPLSERVKVVVSHFKNDSPYQRGVFSGDTDQLGDQAKSILKSQLQISQRFRVMEREAMDSLAREASIGGQTQQLRGAGYAVQGKVTEFGRKNTGDQQLFGVLGRGKNQIAYAKVAINVVDVVTAETIVSVQGAGEYQLSSREVVGFGSSAGYDATLNGKVLDLAIQDAVQALVSQIDAGVLGH